MINEFEVIRRPIISEKGMALAEVARRYVFEVNPRANKLDIKTAVEKLFQVKVVGVRTLVVHGKVKRVGKTQTKKPNRKKAIVTVGVGQKIGLFHSA